MMLPWWLENSLRLNFCNMGGGWTWEIMKRIRSSLKGTSQNVFYSLKRGHRKQLFNTKKSIKYIFIKNVNISDRYGNACRHFRWQPPYWLPWSPRLMTLSHEYNPIIITWWTMATRHIRGDLQLKCFSNIVFTHKRLHSKVQNTQTHHKTIHTQRWGWTYLFGRYQTYTAFYITIPKFCSSASTVPEKLLQSDRLKLFN